MSLSQEEIYWLFDPRLHHFCGMPLRRLLRDLRHHTRRIPVERGDRVRGHIRWGASVKAQSVHGPGAWVSAEVHPDYNLPENQMLQSLFERINAILAKVPAPMQRGWVLSPERVERAAVPLRSLREASRLVQGDERIRQLSPPLQLWEAIAAARATRMEEYRLLAALWEPPAQKLLLIPFPGEEEESWRKLASVLAGWTIRG